MRTCLYLLIIVSGLLWSCTKNTYSNAACDLSVVPVVTTNSPVIAGDSIKLSVSGVKDVFLYNWSGPNGFSSHDSTPVLPGVSSTNAGRYSVDVITNGGCI